MATYNNWTYPTAQEITGATKIKEADNKIQAGIDTISDWTNDTGTYAGSSLKTYIDADLAEKFSTFTEDTVAVEW